MTLVAIGSEVEMSRDQYFRFEPGDLALLFPWEVKHAVPGCMGP